MGLSFFLYLFYFPFFSLMHPPIVVTIIYLLCDKKYNRMKKFISYLLQHLILQLYIFYIFQILKIKCPVLKFCPPHRDLVDLIYTPISTGLHKHHDRQQDNLEYDDLSGLFHYFLFLDDHFKRSFFSSVLTKLIISLYGEVALCAQSLPFYEKFIRHRYSHSWCFLNSVEHVFLTNATCSLQGMMQCQSSLCIHTKNSQPHSQLPLCQWKPAL